MRLSPVLLNKGANVNTADKYGTTPLMATDSVAIAKLLIDHHADVHARDIYGNTALILQGSRSTYHAKYPSEPKAELLLAKGAEINAVDKDGATALMGATVQGKLEMVQLLLKHGAKAGIRNAKHVNVLDLAIFFAPGPPSAKDSVKTRQYYEIQHLLRAHGAVASGPSEYYPPIGK